MQVEQRSHGGHVLTLIWSFQGSGAPGPAGPRGLPGLEGEKGTSGHLSHPMTACQNATTIFVFLMLNLSSSTGFPGPQGEAGPPGKIRHSKAVGINQGQAEP